LNIDWFQIIFYKTQPYSVYIIKTGKKSVSIFGEVNTTEKKTTTM